MFLRMVSSLALIAHVQEDARAHGQYNDVPAADFTLFQWLTVGRGNMQKNSNAPTIAGKKKKTASYQTCKQTQDLKSSKHAFKMRKDSRKCNQHVLDLEDTHNAHG